MYPYSNRTYLLGIALGFPAILPVLWLLWDVIRNIAAAIPTIGAGMIASGEWSPEAEKFGIIPLLCGTTATSLLAAAIWFPVGLGLAVWLGALAPPPSRRRLQMALTVLGSLPTTVAALLGYAVLVPVFGFSLASASGALVLLNLPLFALSSAGAIHQRSGDLVIASESLGLREGAISLLAIQSSWRGIMGAGLSALARSSGESLAVSMIGGNTSFPIWGIDKPIQTLGASLAIGYSNATGTYQDSLVFVEFAMILVVIVLSLAVKQLQSQ